MTVHFDVTLVGHVVDATCVVLLSGESDLYGAPRLKSVLLEAVEAGAQRIVVDMTPTTFIDSTTLGVLLGASKRLRSDGGDLVLVVDHSPIRKIFEVTLLDRAFAIYATRAEALAS